MRHSPDKARLADLAPVALIEVDAQDRVVALNSGAEQLLGLSEAAAMGRTLGEFLFHDTGLFPLIARTRETGAALNAGGIDLRGPGGFEQAGLDVRLACDRDGHLILALSPPLERARCETDPDMAAFGRILSHEVKNPLAGISGAAQLLLRRAGDTDRDLLHLILDETRRIERLCSRLSAFELFSAPDLRSVNVHEIIDAVLRSEAAAFGEAVELARDFDPSLPPILADRDHLHEAILNVVRNGIEAASAHVGQLRPQVAVRTAFETRYSLTDADTGRSFRTLRITVEDSGPGVSPERRARLFDMFGSTKSPTRGLGLSVVKSVIAAHGGRVTIDSRPGRTRFHLFLPLAHGETE